MTMSCVVLVVQNMSNLKTPQNKIFIQNLMRDIEGSTYRPGALMSSLLFYISGHPNNFSDGCPVYTKTNVS